MKFDMKTATQAFQAELHIGNWFSQIGKPSDETQHLFAPFAVERVANKTQMTALMKADAWINIDIDVFNEMLAFADKYSRNGDIINPSAMAIRKIWQTIVADWAAKWVEQGLDEEILEHTAMPIVIRAFQEYVLAQLNRKMVMDFNRNLLRILNLGYLPCGWRYGVAALQQTAHNPLTYITDAMQTASLYANHPFDYQSGTLYVF